MSSSLRRCWVRFTGTRRNRAEPLAEIFADQSFFESLRLEPYYAFAASQVPESKSFYAALIEQTRARRLTLVHGDYSPKNMLVRKGRLILLDHEVIHWGDPAFDVGFALTHLLSKANHLQDEKLIEAGLRFVEIYAAEMGPVYWDENLSVMAARHTLGCMLARVAGRSPLEYLNEAARARQLDWALKAKCSDNWNLRELIESVWTMGLHAGD